jgi:ATP-binding cassette subfamily E protein 1
VLKRFVQQTSKTAFVVEHDLMMATYLADRVIVYEGEPAVRADATAPQPLQPGMNAFLRGLDVSFRRDPETHRPRINKPGSVADKEQKASGDYFYVE